MQPIKILLFDPNPPILSWLEHALYATTLEAKVLTIDNLRMLDDLPGFRGLSLVVVCHSMLAAVVNYLERYHDGQALPFPILVLSDMPAGIDLSKFVHLTIECFPKYSITPPVFEHLVQASQKDFLKNTLLKKMLNMDNQDEEVKRYLQ